MSITILLTVAILLLAMNALIPATGSTARALAAFAALAAVIALILAFVGRGAVGTLDDTDEDLGVRFALIR